MRYDDYPAPVSDPEAEGLPDTADDDSTAYDDVESGREADGPDPASLPADAPLAVDRFGTTPEEARQGESLNLKLARETSDVPAENVLAAPGPGLADEATTEEAAVQARRDADVLDPGPVSDPDSPVSVYDLPDLDDGLDRPVGRIVEPDEGAHTDDEKDAIGYDAGAAGGGFSAEEAAMHEVVPPPD